MSLLSVLEVMVNFTDRNSQKSSRHIDIWGIGFKFKVYFFIVVEYKVLFTHYRKFDISY